MPVRKAIGDAVYGGTVNQGGVLEVRVTTTTNLFLESAFFTPELMAGRARSYGLHTDASHRYERGVDFQLQREAMERATQLFIDAVGVIPQST